MRFRLRTLLICLTACAVLLGLARWRYVAGERERQAIAAIDQGAHVIYGYQLENPLEVEYKEDGFPVSQWWRDRLGDHFFVRVASVRILDVRKVPPQELAAFRSLRRLHISNLGDNENGDAYLSAALAGLPAIEELSISESGVTNRSCPLIGDLRQLRILNLPESRIDDEGVAMLAGLTQLEELRLGKSSPTIPGQITDAGVRHLAKLRRLTALDLEGARLGDGAAGVIGRFSQLEELMLPEATGITDQGFHSLCQLRKLRQLSAGCPQVSDAGLARVPQLANLRLLDLAVGPRVTTAGIESLAQLTKLTGLNLIGAPVDDSGARALASLTQLEDLLLPDAQLGDAGFRSLCQLPKLSSMRVSAPGLTDAGLAKAEGPMSLRILFLHQAPITDASLTYFNQQRGLVIVDLWGTKVTQKGAEWLTAHHPQLRVVRNGQAIPQPWASPSGPTKENTP